MDSSQRYRRSRDGCWTCRRRKKKCDSTTIPCTNCSNLGLSCERDIRLIWEDDTRRDGMKKRGRGITRSGKRSVELEHSTTENIIPSAVESFSGLLPAHHLHLKFCGLSAWPFELDSTESLLLDHYIQKFSKTYPTFSGPTNPFLTVFLPLSTRSRVVLDSMLALSGVQSWENGSFGMGEGMLKLRQKALRGCRQLLTEFIKLDGSSTSTATMKIIGDDLINLFASCMLLLLYEKLAGEGPANWSPHLGFVARLCARSISGFSTVSRMTSSSEEVFRFLLNLFLYNDLVRSTSLNTSTLSDGYLGEMSSFIPQIQQAPNLDRFIFPRLIARIGAADPTVTDAEIVAWDGRLDWLPSFALVSSWNAENSVPIDSHFLILDPHLHRIEHLIQPSELTDQRLVSQLYRIAAMVYRRQRTMERESEAGHKFMAIAQALSSNTLALWATQFVQLLPEGSVYENTLLWPIGIIAKELTLHDEVERAYIVSRLQALERRFHMKLFGCVRDFLLRFWMTSDRGMGNNNDSIILLG